MLREKILERIKKLKKYVQSGVWADPHSPPYTNGYNKAIREEIEALEEIISNLNCKSRPKS